VAGAVAGVKFPMNQREPGGIAGSVTSIAAAFSTPREDFEPSWSAPSSCLPLIENKTN